MGIVAAILLVLGLFSQVTALSYAGVRDQLRARGATVVERGVSGSAPFLAGTDHELLVDGVAISVYEYSTAIGADLDAARISSDGTTFTKQFGPWGGSAATVDYIAPPHWFLSGRVIVLYVGCDTHIVMVLNGVLGSPVADAGEWQAACATRS